MASMIDPTKPIAGAPTTQSVRDNFAAAKSEIEALQAIVSSGTGSPTFDTVTVTNRFLAADGSAAAPAYSFSLDPDTGMLRGGANDLRFAAGGTTSLQVLASKVNVDLLDIGGIAGTSCLLRPDAANTLAQRNGTAPQQFRLYNTFTDASNYERLLISAGATFSMVLQIEAGTGVARGLNIGTNGAAALNLVTSNIARWTVNSSGQLIGATDNTYDIGASGATRPRSGYFGTSILVGGGGTLVNTIELRGNITAAYPQIDAEGSDVDVGLNLNAKGAGSIRLRTSAGAAEQFRVAHVASAVNYVQASGAATGSAPNLIGAGSDTNVGLNISSKGTGSIAFATNSLAVTQMVVTHTASAVNQVAVSGSATGGKVTVSAIGSDTNVGMQIQSKGTGNIDLQPNSGDIAWEKPLVTLGGGATATLGTIGGSGPATAAQNSWERRLDSTGAACWVPVWK